MDPIRLKLDLLPMLRLKGAVLLDMHQIQDDDRPQILRICSTTVPTDITPLLH